MATGRDLVLEVRMNRIAVKQLEVQLEDAKTKLNKAETDLINYLEAQGAEATERYDCGWCSLPKPTLYASCSEENKDTLFQYLKDTNRADLIKETVNPRTLSTFAKELIDSGKEIPDCINYHFVQKVKFNDPR